jgi:hypothetical protein
LNNDAGNYDDPSPRTIEDRLFQSVRIAEQ